MWMLVMIMPPLISYFQKENPLIANILLTTLYPITLAFLIRRNNFWVSPLLIVLSSVISFVVSLLVSEFTDNETVRTITQVAVFVLALTGLSTQMDMYGPNITDG